MRKIDPGIGKRLQAARILLGYVKKQGEFASRLGIQQNTLSNYENGNREVPSNILALLSQRGINLDWLLTGEGTYHAKEKNGVDFVREGDFLSEEDRELLELLRENKELVGLLRKYGKLKECVEDVQMQVVLTPKMG